MEVYKVRMVFSVDILNALPNPFNLLMLLVKSKTFCKFLTGFNTRNHHCHQKNSHPMTHLRSVQLFFFWLMFYALSEYVIDK